MFLDAIAPVRVDRRLTSGVSRIFEEDDVYAAVDARTESLQSLRELGPPDLVYLVKQPKTNANRQVCVGISDGSIAFFAAHMADNVRKHRLAFIIILLEPTLRPPPAWQPTSIRLRTLLSTRRTRWFLGFTG